MSDKLFGLAGLGLDDLENMDIYGQDKKEEKAAAEAPKIEEKDLIFDKTFKYRSGSSCKIRRH